MKRLFIASKIDFDNDLASVLKEIKESLTEENIRWVEPSNLHLTFQFLGNTEEDKIPKLIELIAHVAGKSKAFEIKIESAGLFKNITNPNSIWFGLMKNENLNTLKYLLDRNLEKLNYPINNQTFKPHLTIGRLDKLNKPEKLVELLQRFQHKIITKQQSNEVVLFESVLKSSGPIYIPLFKGKLTHDVL